ncbi:U7 snRNA-associated sm-like protein lsm10 [Plakobranchus ocellatus]|uniref:U7 snRNA-associated sm-like protein lsm10 n=1 Tax=Plakobranchus ocellatus TaxID=259542 RepID=A0AAV4B586_9GAST|nr:U7 snRNA-associated sm-like protein lsm10 [Plakobranchus ocellatus]
MRGWLLRVPAAINLILEPTNSSYPPAAVLFTMQFTAHQNGRRIARTSPAAICSFYVFIVQWGGLASHCATDAPTPRCLAIAFRDIAPRARVIFLYPVQCINWFQVGLASLRRLMLGPVTAPSRDTLHQHFVIKMSQNGEDVNMKEETLTAEEEAEAQTLLDHGISKAVAKELLSIYKTEKLSQSDLDDRAMDALKEFSPEDAIKVLRQFCESNLEHVGNKSAFLCGQMKTYRHKLRAGNVHPLVKGPDEAKLKEILDRTGYTLDVTTGQRKFGGPPPGGDPTPPGSGHEIFCGKIPKDVFEDELIPFPNLALDLSRERNAYLSFCLPPTVWITDLWTVDKRAYTWQKCEEV